MNTLMPFCIARWQLIENIDLRARRQEGVNRFLGRISPRLNPQPYPKHITAQELVGRMGREAFKEYLSFAIVRNPWDWQVSLYTYMMKSPDHSQHETIRKLGSFENYIRWRCKPGNFPLQRDCVCSSDGELLVDYLGRYESLDENFCNICNRIGIHASLPRLNVSNTRPYRQFYDGETRELVREFCGPDCALFGYEF